MGLRVVQDVVYNHTFASGLDRYSVLDKVVPGYYHRRMENGDVCNSTCCNNTATEHCMAGRRAAMARPSCPCHVAVTRNMCNLQSCAFDPLELRVPMLWRGSANCAGS